MSLFAETRLRKLQSGAFLALVLFTTMVFVWMIRGFLLPVFWAAVFAVLFQRIHVRLLTVCRST
jgi:predicted PurR-regulated permease PerM